MFKCSLPQLREVDAGWSLAGNPVGSRAIAVPLTTTYIVIQLLMDTIVPLQEIEARVVIRAFGAAHNPVQVPNVRQVLAELRAVMDATSPDGVI